MNKINGIIYVFLIVVGITILILLGNVKSARTIVVPDDYAKIQWAIDNATSGDIIEVHNGTYYEIVNVNKQLTLLGIGMPVVDARGSGSTITLAADGIKLEGFSVTGAGDYYLEAGVNVISNSNTLISNYASSNYGSGIALRYCNNNTLIGNTASDNMQGIGGGGYGISLWYSSNNTLTHNNAWGNKCGISLAGSNNNELSDNNANSNSPYGIYLQQSSNNNTLIGNNANLNGVVGIFMGNTNNNLIYNNIFNNTNNIQFMNPNINNWNITKQSGTNIIGGHYLGGNFWVRPNGYGPKCIDSEPDGICDLPYELNSNNIDFLPLTY